MLSFQQQQNGANGEQLAPAMRLRDDPPPITPASTRNPRKRKSPPSLNPDPSTQQIHHVLPPPHPLIHSIPPPPIPPFPYPTADYSPGGLPPPQTPQSDPTQQPSPTQSSAAGRSLSQSKRAEQNRKAQRAFRERRDQHVKALESRSQLLDAALASADEANRRWEECRALVDQLRVENAALRAALSQSQLLSPTNALAPLPPPPPPPGLAAPAPNTVSEPHSGSREEQTPSTVPGEDVKHHEPGLDKRSSAKD
ncbi:hypothetical protein M378DRAFT_184822 [Amanita muscaria Koide BX008]|uniref:BZIP domain-containing protein n=1 Tax=Amanita muscaria (strain Koide BX008) TaxID=946122 RepID=A0A0C2X430_AMAMK|nr:hypothetical protein M378DRAFT_184822 [Amanita muscaria Koide BX008]